MESAQLCDLCRLVVSAVEQVLASMKRVREEEYEEILVSHQLWLCGTARCDGIQILSISRNKPDVPYVLCGIGFCVDEGKYNEDSASSSPPFICDFRRPSPVR